MHRLICSMLVLAVGALPSSALAQNVAQSTLDSLWRPFVVSGVIRALHHQIASTITDSASSPWVLFPNDPDGHWARERAGLARMLRARTPHAGDQFVTVLPIPKVTITEDSLRAFFSVLHYERCGAAWTASGTEYVWSTPLAYTWAVEGPRVVRFNTGMRCEQIARNPGYGASPPFDDEGGSSPR